MNLDVWEVESVPVILASTRGSRTENFCEETYDIKRRSCLLEKRRMAKPNMENRIFLKMGIGVPYTGFFLIA